uniref:Uncharacterized protein n=1 Tax=Parascaris equorum TaxID=6256 RepID=A0A914S3M9_PAREQ
MYKFFDKKANGSTIFEGIMFDLAEKFKAAVFFAEHRYYGASMPFGNLSNANASYLGYLSSTQALADFAKLITLIKTDVLKCPPDTPGGNISPGAFEKVVKEVFISAGCNENAIINGLEAVKNLSNTGALFISFFFPPRWTHAAANKLSLSLIRTKIFMFTLKTM